jgi:CIC family chloride channel protein
VSRYRFLDRLISYLLGQLARITLDKASLVSQSRIFLRVVAIGILVGIAAFVFHESVSLVEDFTHHKLMGLTMPRPARDRPADEQLRELFAGDELFDAMGRVEMETGAPPPRLSHRGDPDTTHISKWLFLVPAIGGLIVGLISIGLAPEYIGDGTDVAIRAHHQREGYMPKLVTLRKMVASVVTVGTGGSSGLEGPIAQGGAGIASAVADRWGMSPAERRRFAIAGLAAGVGAIFRAPLGGAIYAVEVLYRDNEFESDSLIPAFMASIVSYSMFCTLSNRGWGALFAMPEMTFHAPLVLFYYLGMAVVLAVVGGFYVKMYDVALFLFKPRRFMPRWSRPMIGGLALGLLALKAPYVLGSGYGYLQGALDDEYSLKFLLAMGVLKIFATSLTLGSGGAGGAFAPSLVIGGMLGGAFGVVGQQLGIVEHPGPMVLVGMAGFFAGVSKAPVAALIMVSEMTFGYGLLVPLMLVTGVTYALVPRFISMHHSQVNNRRESPAHRADYIIDVLRGLRVADILDRSAVPPLVPMTTPLSDLNILFTRTQHEALPIVDEDDRMQGLVLLDDIREHLLTADFGGLILAADLMRHDVEPVRLSDDASTALGRLLAGETDELPVVEESSPGTVVGSITRREIIHLYYKQMSALAKAPVAS